MTATNVAPVRKFLSALTQTTGPVKKTRNGWDGRCPSHEDRKASLSVSEGADGRVLLRCHAGCATDAICRALGLEVRDLYPPRERPTKPQVVATYRYARADGTPVFDVLRFRPKDFRQRKADGTWGLTDLSPEDRALPFHLPEIAANPGRIVAVCEGERDVLTLEELGLVATTNAAGALKWSEHHTRHLVDAGVVECVVFADADDPGRRHGLSVAQSLQAAGIACWEVWVPTCSCCKDVSDLAARHGDIPGWPVVNLLATAPEMPSTTSTPDQKSRSQAINSVDTTVDTTVDTVDVPDLRTLGLLGEVAQAVADSVQIAPEFALATALGVLGIATGLGGSVVVSADHRYSGPSFLDILVVADPGERKSPTLDALTVPLFGAERVLRDQRDEVRRQALGERAALEVELAAARKARDAAAIASLTADLEGFRVPAPFLAVTESPTPEALERLAGEHDGRIGLVTDEAAALFGAMGRYATTPSYDVLLKGYDAGRLRSNRNTRADVALQEVRVPVLGMIQPGPWRRLRDEPVAVTQGLVARLCVVVPRSLVGTRDPLGRPLDEAVMTQWDRQVQRLLVASYTAEDRVAWLGEAAFRVWWDYAALIERRLKEDLTGAVLRGWGQKHPSRLARLAAMLHALDTGRLGGEIAATTVERAVPLADWLLAHAVREHGGGPRLSQDAQRLLGWARGREEFARREAVRAHHGWTASRFDSAMRELIQAGLGEEVGRARYTVAVDEMGSSVDASTQLSTPPSTPFMPSDLRKQQSVDVVDAVDAFPSGGVQQ